MKNNKIPGPARLTSVLSVCVLALGLSACGGTIDVRGNDPNPDMLAMISEGQQSKADVAALLGSPSTTATFDNETWYYISSTFKNVAFFAPEEIDRKIVAVRFDEQGLVKDVATFGLQDGEVVQVSERETPTAGHEIGLLEQLFGNLGRFGSQN